MVDALTPQLSGIGRYCWELAQRLPHENDIENVQYRRGDQWVTNLPELLELGASQSKRLPKILRGLTRVLDKSRLRKSIIHGPNYFLPAEADSGVITVHDLSVFNFPETHPVARIRHFEENFQSSIDRAAMIITDSEAVRQELIGFRGVGADRICTISLGFDSQFRQYPQGEVDFLLRQYQLQYGKYGLCVSTLEPRKKISELLLAWRMLKPEVRDQNPLVIIGPKGWLNDNLNSQIDRGKNEGWLRNLGYVPEEHLPLIYGGAALFVYPSIYEGFGLPPLEAMASGVPVIVADQACAREICGNAAIYINPNDNLAFINAIYNGLVDTDWREAAVEKGLQRSGNYSWEKCVSETVKLYRVLGKH
jgi:glycosyltransferase involved in cell wall biosynthesis